MNEIKKKSVCTFLLLWGFLLHAQTSFDFPGQDISEILYSVSLARSFPIICDDTVSGTASFRFTGGNFETAFDSFLLYNRLYVTKEDNRWIVSRMRIIHNDDGTFNLDVFDLSPERIFEKLSEACTMPVVFDALPATPVSLHLSSVDICSAVGYIMRKYGGYCVSLGEGCISVEKEVAANPYAMPVEASSGRTEVVLEDGLFSVDLEDSLFSEVLEEIASLSGIEFCSLFKSDVCIRRLSFSGRTLEETLSLVCAQAEAGFRHVEGIYVFLSDQNASRHYREEEEQWYVFTLEYITSAEACRLMELRFPELRFSSISSYSFMCCSVPAMKLQVESYLSVCDTAPLEHVVSLKFIKPDAFMSSLPPGFSSADFKMAGSTSTLFYTGSTANFHRLQSFLEYMDRPAELISYDILIVQAQKSLSDSWSSGFETSSLTPGNSSGLKGVLSSAFSFNIDVVAAFGYLFSAKLQAAVAENRAKVFADTTLHGVSGVPISFRNTSTYRYRDPYLDEDSGKTSGVSVTREIVSGLVLDITGWVSGDGMITTSVTASYSRRGSESSSAGNPPPTSEKMITTQVRGRSGEVIVLSGLYQEDMSRSGTGTPLISAIPVLGKLFSSEEDIEEKTEMIIYLIPRTGENDDSVPEEKQVSVISTMKQALKSDILRQAEEQYLKKEDRE